MSRATGAKSKRGAEDPTAEEFYKLIDQLKVQKTTLARDAREKSGGNVWAKARALFYTDLQAITQNTDVEVKKAVSAGCSSLKVIDVAVTAAAAKSAALLVSSNEAFTQDAADIARLRSDLTASIARFKAVLGAADQDASRALETEIRRLGKTATREYEEQVGALYQGLAEKARAASAFLLVPSVAETV